MTPLSYLRRKKADPVMKDTIKELLHRMRLGILQPRFCSYTEKEGTIEFGVVCRIFKANSEAERASVAACVRDLFAEGAFMYDKPWIEEDSDENGEAVSYSYPPKLTVRLE